jgi:hypothetical protein
MSWRSIIFGVAIASSLGWYFCNNALDHAWVFNTEKVVAFACARCLA